jgi:hypothetical protein
LEPATAAGALVGGQLAVGAGLLQVLVPEREQLVVAAVEGLPHVEVGAVPDLAVRVDLWAGQSKPTSD